MSFIYTVLINVSIALATIAEEWYGIGCGCIKKLEDKGISKGPELKGMTTDAHSDAWA
jgi:hypothetical protein